MIVIQKEYFGYLVRVKEPGFGRFSARAKTIAEVNQCVEHYYCNEPSHHSERGPKSVKRCPFCARCEALERKARRA